jgi:Mrp family chromosome partitioning ATPase
VARYPAIHPDPAPIGGKTGTALRAWLPPQAPAKAVRKVHTILPPKNGCGKIYVASFIAQALHERGDPVVCFDTDRENASLRHIPAL